jgi:hypothetical protein
MLKMPILLPYDPVSNQAVLKRLFFKIFCLKKWSMPMIKKMVFIILLFLLIMVYFPNRFSAAENQNLFEGWTDFYDELFEISFVYPESWTNYTSQERGVILVLPDGVGMFTYRYSPLFNEKMNLSEFISQNRETLQEMGAEFIEDEYITFSNAPAYKLVYALPLGKDTQKYLMVWCLIEDNVYITTFSHQSQYFDQYRLEVDKIIDHMVIN